MKDGPRSVHVRVREYTIPKGHTLHDVDVRKPRHASRPHMHDDVHAALAYAHTCALDLEYAIHGKARYKAVIVWRPQHAVWHDIVPLPSELELPKGSRQPRLMEHAAALRDIGSESNGRQL
jgi:hypothetical protein